MGKYTAYLTAVLHDNVDAVRYASLLITPPGVVTEKTTPQIFSVEGDKLNKVSGRTLTMTDGRYWPIGVATKIVGGMVLLASLASAYEGYSVAVTTGSLRRALIQAGLNCLMTAPITVLGAAGGLLGVSAMLFLTCGLPTAASIVGIGQALISESVPSLIVDVARGNIRSMLGGLLRGFGGGIHPDAFLSIKKDPFELQRVYSLAYNEAFGTRPEEDIRNTIKQLNARVDELNKRLSRLENNFSLVSKNYAARISLLEGRVSSLEQESQRINDVVVFGPVGWDFTQVAKERIKTIVLESDGIRRLINGEIEKALKNVKFVSLEEFNKRLEMYNQLNAFLRLPTITLLPITAQAFVRVAERVSRIDERVSGVEERLGTTDRSLKRLEGKVSTIEQGLNEIKWKLDSIRKAAYPTDVLAALEERIDSCCLPGLSPGEAEDLTRRLRNRPRRFPSFLNKLLHGGLIPSGIRTNGLFLTLLSAGGIIYAVMIDSVVNALVNE